MFVFLPLTGIKPSPVRNQQIWWRQILHNRWFRLKGESLSGGQKRTYKKNLVNIFQKKFDDATKKDEAICTIGVQHNFPVLYGTFILARGSSETGSETRRRRSKQVPLPVEDAASGDVWGQSDSPVRPGPRLVDRRLFQTDDSYLHVVPRSVTLAHISRDTSSMTVTSRAVFVWAAAVLGPVPTGWFTLCPSHR